MNNTPLQTGSGEFLHKEITQAISGAAFEVHKHLNSRVQGYFFSRLPGCRAQRSPGVFPSAMACQYSASTDS